MRPSHTTSVRMATADKVISEKLMNALLMAELIGTDRCRMAVILIG
jgi:hypothetical protein